MFISSVINYLFRNTQKYIINNKYSSLKAKFGHERADNAISHTINISKGLNFFKNR